MRYRRPLIVSLIIIVLLTAWQIDAFAEAAPNEKENVVELEPTAEDRAQLRQIELVLNTVPSGRNALALMEKYQVRVKFIPGSGSYYLSSPNTVVIDAVVDANHGPERAALTFVHEMSHAQYVQEGLAADIWSDTREEFIELKLAEEAEAVVRSIETKAELHKAGLDVGPVTYPLEEAYWDGFRVATKSAAAQNGDVTVSELLAIGREAGKQTVVDGFMNGQVWASNSLQPYPEYYGTDWDSKNATPCSFKPLFC